MYYLHPSRLLTELFGAKPYQGAPPDRAKFLFIGLDANYSETIESESIFPKILEYHEDGAAFWRKYGVHHPFLLPGYSGSGRKYHQNFAKIGFGKEHADSVSFAELMHIPTTGQSRLEIADLYPDHLNRLNEWILDGEAEHVFFPAGVTRLLRSTKQFPWIPARPLVIDGHLKILLDRLGKRVVQHLHFSNYGKFEQRLREEAVQIRGLLQ